MNKKNINYDVIVIGAGHSGLEAAFAAGNLNKKVLLVTFCEKTIANCPCNPSVGGPAKGIVTREIDALGGMQGIAVDNCMVQIKLLNQSRGPGVQALRAQIDKEKYHQWFLDKLKNHSNITILYSEIIDFVFSSKKIIGVLSKNKEKFFSKTIIVTTGTYLKSIIYRGNMSKESGPDSFESSCKLSNSLIKIGFNLIRLKTGTPPRIQENTINYGKLTKDLGSDKKLSFSHFEPKYISLKDQLPCYVLKTNNRIHKFIRSNINKAPLYAGLIKGVGPKYCPSIEDKVMNFIDKDSHQLFLEPQTRNKKTNTMYLGGFSTSLPEYIQDKIVRMLPGLENCVIKEYGYAIEYDAIDPTQLKLSLASKKYENLFFAGQINGTSGYEEAAGQGLVAGINACMFVDKKEPLILKRSESYIGVMIDDIVTKGIIDPYRLLTSRAEYRLFLRNDNADDRLIEKGYKIGLVKSENYKFYLDRKKIIDNLINKFKKTTIGQLKYLSKYSSKTNISIYDFLKRPEIKLNLIEDSFEEIKNLTVIEQEKILIKIKYEGYISKCEKEIKQIKNLQNTKLDKIKNFKLIKNLSNEAAEKLNKIKPLNLDQASRISGVNFNDLINIKRYLEKK